jgi:hypothetical protein
MLNMFLSVFVVVLIATLSLSGNAFCAERLIRNPWMISYKATIRQG